MDDKKRKSIPTWVWITLAAIALVILIWFIQNLMGFLSVMALLGGAAEGTAESIFPLRDN